MRLCHGGRVRVSIMSTPALLPTSTRSPLDPAVSYLLVEQVASEKVSALGLVRRGNRGGQQEAPLGVEGGRGRSDFKRFGDSGKDPAAFAEGGIHKTIGQEPRDGERGVRWPLRPAKG